jgi:hypothetical protein
MVMAFTLLPGFRLLSQIGQRYAEFCLVQSQGGEIAAAAEAPNLKTTPGFTVRNGKAIAERAVGIYFYTVSCPREQVRIAKAASWLVGRG